jgi:hypothetical protein
MQNFAVDRGAAALDGVAFNLTYILAEFCGAVLVAQMHVQQATEDWAATVEEFLALQSILQSSFRCWLDTTELQISPDEAERLIEEGSRDRRLTCCASIHVALPDAGIPLQVCKSMIIFRGVVEMRRHVRGTSQNV